MIELRGLDSTRLAEVGALGAEEVASSIRVHTVEAEGTAAAAPDRPPTLGEAEIVDGVVRWRPRFPLAPGYTYRARWAPAGNGESIEARLTVPATVVDDPPEVSAIHPASATVPANLLRAYVHFSRPMTAGRALDHVRVLADGEPVDDALVVPETELWNPDGDRLTLLFDPGRIKQGVGPNLEVGAPLREGMVVELRVEAGWPDHRGAALVAPAARLWRVAAADRTRPDAGRWELSVPGPGTAEALEITLPEALDHALLARLVRVEGAAGVPVAGDVTIGRGDRLWAFRPSEAWRPGDYVVRVGPEIEDLAGNSLARLFDEPLRAGRVGEAEMPDVTIPFRVGGR